MTTRYALYWTPERGSRLAGRLASLLGRDAFSGARPPFPAEVPPGWRDATRAPRRYGAHATLKAPFRLAEGADEETLIAALARFNADLSPVDLGGLELTPIEGEAGVFLALTPRRLSRELSELERRTVVEFEPFRAPLNEAEIARRRPERLTERQRAQLAAFGYPYVFDDFRPHVTLTGPLEDPEPACAALSRALGDVGADEARIASVTLFRQRSGEDFWALGG
jgi:2'-5' RNA ligase